MTPNVNNEKLLLPTLIKFSLEIGIFGLFLFLCAGDILFWNAWLYLTVYMVAIFSLCIYLYINDKELLQKRLNSNEKEKVQDVYNFATGVSFISIFVICGFDYRFDWSPVPVAVVIIALVIMLVGYGLFVITLVQNSFASRTVEIQDRQKVIDTGVYAIIRHPMYTSALIMFVATPILLGSYYALIPMVVFSIGIILRIRNEEKVLREGLAGYSDYMLRVRYRLIPFIW